MNKQLSIGVGLALILVGVATLAASMLNLFLGFRIWHLWPVTVLALGLLTTVPPLFSARKPRLGWLFIPGLPILTTGVILLLASVLRWWRFWSVLWPLEVISLALGFLFAALKTRHHWLLAPAILIGANGLVLQFCATTGWWRAWSVLWTIEPLAVGLALLTLNVRHPSRALLTTGLVFCALGAFGFLESLAITSMLGLRRLWWLWRWMAPLTVILIGGGLLAWSLVHREPASRPKVLVE